MKSNELEMIKKYIATWESVTGKVIALDKVIAWRKKLRKIT